MSKETGEVVAFLLTIGEAAAVSLDDGEITLSDALYFFDSLRKVSDAVKDSDKIPQELLNWGPEDTAQMIELAKDFDIPQENIEAIVKDAIKVAGPIIEFLAKFKHKT